MKDKRIIAVIYAFSAAVFYAVNTPLSKLLLEYVSPTFLASFLYLGAGVGVGALYAFGIKNEKKEDKLTKKELPYTLGMITLDIAAPIFLMFGIKLGNPSNASLLGNFEIVATTTIALLIFKEKVSKKLWIAIAFITASSIILSFDGTDGFAFSFGSLFVILATLCWGLENNCTRKLSDKSTYEIVTLKGICSGTGSFVVALLLNESIPKVKYIILAMLLGFVAYGLSIFTYCNGSYKLIIEQEYQMFLGDTSIYVDVNDQKNILLGNGKMITLIVDKGEIELLFHKKFRKTWLRVSISKDTKILVCWNRANGKIEAYTS